jgi:hypothetical protein
MGPVEGQIAANAVGKARNNMNGSRGAMAIASKSQPDEGGYYRWAEPNSDITVCLKTETVDRLQMDVLRGIASSPRAGKEVGGVLLGRTEMNQGCSLTFVDDFAPFPCAHRNGPFYDLTPTEAAGFEAALARGRTHWEQSVVGYYRSHNRDGMFLSPGDLQLIQRHFPAPENIFLIIKTLPNGACTAGFFFWKDGRIQSEFTDSEAPLIPISFTGAIEEPAPPEAIAQVPDNSVVAATTEFMRRGILRRRLIRGIAITGVAAAATVAVIRYRAHEPVHGRPAPEIPLVAKGTVPAPPKTASPESRRKPMETTPDPPERKLATDNVQPAVTLPSNPDASIPASPTPSISSAVPETEVANPPAAGEPVFLTAEKAPAAVTGAPLNPAPHSPPETAITPAPPVTPPISGAAPLTPAALPPTAAPPAAAERSASPSPSLPSPTYTRVGAQVIHQAPLAVPRGVGPKITTDVELDVEVVIDVKGKVTRARVVSTKGAAAGLLAIEALKAAQLFRFQPAQENGRNISSLMVLTFRFDQIAK